MHNSNHLRTSQKSKLISNLSRQLLTNDKNLTVFFDETLSWQPLNKVSALTTPGLQALKFKITVDRFTQGKLTIDGVKTGSLFVNGEEVSGTKNSYQLKLPTGEHLVLFIAEQVDDWNKVALDFTGNAEHDTVTISREPITQLSAKQLFDSPTVSSLSLSPNAKQLIVATKRYNDKNKNKALRHIELKDTKSMKTLYAWQASASNFTWSENNKYLVYTSQGSLWQLNRKTLERTLLSEQLSGISNLRYISDTSLLFSWNKPAKKSTSLTKHYQGLEDRWSYARNTNQVYMLDIASGFVRQLTSPKHSHSLQDFDKQRNTVLVSRSHQDYKAPPHMLTELVEVSLNDNTEKTIGKYRTFNGAQYGDDHLYINAGPAFMNGAGIALSDGLLPNNYDGQLYKVSLDGKDVTPLSKRFDPAIGRFDVLQNNDVVLSVTEKDTKQLYLFDESKNKFNKINTNLDIVERHTLSLGKSPSIVFAGTTASTPQQVGFKSKLTGKKAKTLWDSQSLAYKNTRIPKLEEFNFTNSDGVEIHGRVYLPTKLDKSKKYPALVYYYGGTSPVTRGFTGRYPFNFWAENGYVVYVLQPTGATGFGQEFSAKHVNAWGQYTANDIIEGTQAFLNQYSFVDAKKVGNLGASYGGFMTMLLATKTDMFSASIAHAGISNITSYWGQGWWGYLYSGEASKLSFPWNNAQLYSQHSPVFHADKVSTPLLLIHGDADTNVPPGESHNMYTALKLIEQDVELVEYKGADHQIFARDKRFTGGIQNLLTLIST